MTPHEIAIQTVIHAFANAVSVAIVIGLGTVIAVAVVRALLKAR